MKRVAGFLALAMLAACAGYSGSGLKPGGASLEDVIAVMGTPAMQWADPDGSRQLAYPRGPMGVHTYMVLIGRDGKVSSIENVLASASFARVGKGMSAAEVLRLLGPSEPAWSVYFKARDEVVWEWRYCDDWNQLARFDVLFDAGKMIVRSTMTLREEQIGHCGGSKDGGGCWCSH